MNVEKLKNSRSRSASSGRKFISVAENLRNVSTKSRECKKRKIEEENNKFFNRLVNTSSTMSKVFWMRNIRDIQNYK